MMADRPSPAASPPAHSSHSPSRKQTRENRGLLMDPTTRDILQRLGVGEAIDSVCRDTGWSRAGFDAWWQRETASRAPRCDGEVPAAVSEAVSIERDRWGIPHIVARRRDDLWLGFGYAMAQDRLFQMDYLRRKGLGRLA